MVLRNGEVRWFLCCCVFFWFWGFFSLPMVEVLVATACLWSCGREQCCHLATVPSFFPFLHTFACSRPLRQQPVQSWCTKPMGGPHVSLTCCLLHDTVVVKWGLRGGRNLSQTTLLNLPGYCWRDSWALRPVSALRSRQPVPVLLQRIAMELPR